MGFVVGIAFAILIDDTLGLGGGLWDTLALVIGVACAVGAIRRISTTGTRELELRRRRPRGVQASRLPRNACVTYWTIAPSAAATSS